MRREGEGRQGNSCCARHLCDRDPRQSNRCLSAQFARVWLCASLVLAAIALTALAAPASAETGRPRLKLQRVVTRGTDEIQLRVLVYSPVPLGAYTLEVSFDPSLAELVGIAGGEADFAASPAFDRNQFSSGVVRLSAFQARQMSGPRGRCHVATLTLRSRVERARARISLKAPTIADTSGLTYEVREIRKTFTLRRR